MTFRALPDPSYTRGAVSKQCHTFSGGLSGPFVEGELHYRLTVSGARTITEGDRLRRTGINFVIPKDQKDRLTQGLKAGPTYPVKLTVTVKQGKKGFWIAVVSAIEREN